MKMSAECVHCVVNQLDSYFLRFVGDGKERFDFLRAVCAEVGAMDEETLSSVLSTKMMRVIKSRAGEEDLFAEEKRIYNQAVLEIEADVAARVAAADDRLGRALQYAMTGNYIDFGLVREVNREKLNELIEAAPGIELQPMLERLRRDIGKARFLVYVLDNCGEAVFDKICIRTLKELYPDLHITAMVRGMPVYNDVTMADAREIGLDALVDVVSNGDDLPGTLLSRISDEARALLESADVIISKGMGNYETFMGCGLNVYYMLLCKCERFARDFGKPLYDGIFTSELPDDAA
jgi:uncharacterized protein with ATP-grasp and redox domains